MSGRFAAMTSKRRRTQPDPEPPFNLRHRNGSFGGTPAVRSSHVTSGRSVAIISTTAKCSAVIKAQANGLVSCTPTQFVDLPEHARRT